MTTSNSKQADRGQLIAIEGVDGIGKSTIVPMVAELLRSKTGKKVTVHREPGGTALGERIRQVLLGEGAPPVNGHSAAMLFSAARHALINEVVRPALERGEVVILDRFVLSTYVYQGEQGVDPSTIEALTKIACGDTWPDAVVVLTLGIKELEKRRNMRKGDQDRFDSAQNMSVGKRRQENYIALSNTLPNGVAVDVGGTPEENATKIVDAILPMLSITAKAERAKISR